MLTGGKGTDVRVGTLEVAPADTTAQAADAHGAPAITITRVPPAGADSGMLGTIAGQVRGGSADGARLVVYARTDVWYVQPTVGNPFTAVAADGTWEANIHGGAQYAVLLVTPAYAPAATITSLPEVGGLVLAIETATAEGADTGRKLTFSGIEWAVKASDGRVGPGPNLFSDREENVWLDDTGRLHLKITEHDGEWYCAEVISESSFGYGTYRFYLDTPVDDLDPNVVLGLFTWSDDPGFHNREIDIECSRWTNADSDANAQFVVQPYTAPDSLHRFTLPPSIPNSTHTFTWEPHRVLFGCLKGHGVKAAQPTDVIDEWVYSGRNIPEPGTENARINLWLVSGKVPQRQRSVEVVVNKFEFVSAN